MSAGAGQSPPREHAQLEWWLDRLEDPDFHLGAADRGIVAQLVRNVLAGAGQVPADTIALLTELVDVCERGYFTHRWLWHRDEARQKFDGARAALAAVPPEEQDVSGEAAC